MVATIKSWYAAVELCNDNIDSLSYVHDVLSAQLKNYSSSQKATDDFALRQKFLDELGNQLGYIKNLASIENTIWKGDPSSIDLKVPSDENYQKHAQSMLKAPPIPPLIFDYSIDEIGKFMYDFLKEDYSKLEDTDQQKVLQQVIQTWLVANKLKCVDQKICDEDSGKPIDLKTLQTKLNATDALGFINYTKANKPSLDIEKLEFIDLSQQQQVAATK